MKRVRIYLAIAIVKMNACSNDLKIFYRRYLSISRKSECTMFSSANVKINPKSVLIYLEDRGHFLL